MPYIRSWLIVNRKSKGKYICSASQNEDLSFLALFLEYHENHKRTRLDHKTGPSGYTGVRKPA
jgi:hypothetical protein